MSTARHPERVPGLHLRVARMQRGLVPRDVARQLSVSPRRISSFESAGTTADRHFDALGRLDAVGTCLDELWPSERAIRRGALHLSLRSGDSANAPVAKPDRSPRGSTGA